MRKLLSLATAALLVAPVAVQAQTIDFESGPGTCTPAVANGFAGFNWSNFHHYDKSCLSSGGYGAGVVSGTQAIFNAWGAQASVLESAANNPFRLVSAWVTAAWNSGMQLQVTGLLNGVQQYQQLLAVNYASPTLLAFNGALVDEVRFIGVGGADANPNDGGSGRHIAVDDLTIVGALDPGVLVLVLFGLVGLAIAGRTRQRDFA